MEQLLLGNYKIENAKEESNKLTFCGYACHFNSQNLNREIVNEKSFKTFFEMYHEKKITPVINYNHDSNWIIGGINDIVSDSTGLYLEAYLNKGVKICDEMLIPNILNSTINGLSTEGYILNGDDGIMENEDGSYYVKDFLLTAVAITATPADYNARLSLNSYIEAYAAKKASKKTKWYLF